MSAGKRIYRKREMPDPEIMAQFKTIPASNTAGEKKLAAAKNGTANRAWVEKALEYEIIDDVYRP